MISKDLRTSIFSLFLSRWYVGCETGIERVVSLTLKPVECGHDSFVDTELVKLTQE